MYGVSILSERERVIKPSRWRKQHGRVEAVNGQVQDVDGNIGAPYRGIGLLDEWERSGKITREMRLAGERFHELFHQACLDPLYAADMSRVGGSPAPGKHRGAILARNDVHAALDFLGGDQGLMGSAAWSVLGWEYSIRHWAMSWVGHPMSKDVAAGVLLGALGSLAVFFERHARQR